MGLTDKEKILGLIDCLTASLDRPDLDKKHAGAIIFGAKLALHAVDPSFDINGISSDFEANGEKVGVA